MQGLMAGTSESAFVKLDDLKGYPPPPPTKSYYPIAHEQLARSIKTYSQDILRDYALVGDDYVIARNGNQLFALLKFKAEDSGMGMSVCFRNSYDKSMSIGFACGGSVFCCSNLMMSGDITVMKKHTPGVAGSLEDSLITTLHRARYTYSGLIRDADTMRRIRMDDERAAKLAGFLYWNGIISPRQLPVLKEQWLNPKHPEFEPRNVFSFYNACTESLKTSPPNNIMERHIDLHKVIIGSTEMWS